MLMEKKRNEKKRGPRANHELKKRTEIELGNGDDDVILPIVIGGLPLRNHRQAQQKEDEFDPEEEEEEISPFAFPDLFQGPVPFAPVSRKARDVVFKEDLIKPIEGEEKGARKQIIEIGKRKRSLEIAGYRREQSFSSYPEKGIGILILGEEEAVERSLLRARVKTLKSFSEFSNIPFIKRENRR